MNFCEAMAAAFAGRKVARKSWMVQEHLELDPTSGAVMAMLRGRLDGVFPVRERDFLANDWEERP